MIEAFNFFNREIFDNLLPAVVITLQRKKGSRGYYVSGRFATRDGQQVTDEIALNPAYFAERTTKEIHSTVVHEQAHLWQKLYGEVGRPGYHNVQWGRKMEAMGLMPSSTGEPGGDRTGDKMSHYIVTGGLFDSICDKLIASGFAIEFVDRVVKSDAGKAGTGSPSRKNKAKYSCSGCGTHVWGQAGHHLICGDCQVILTTN